MDTKITLKQLRKDLETLSDDQFKAKYAIDVRVARALGGKELEARLTRQAMLQVHE
jgi:hypothetical protein